MEGATRIFKLSTETRAAMAAAHKQRAVRGVHTETGEVVILPSTRAGAERGWASSNIVACCRGRRKACYGFTWSYMEAT